MASAPSASAEALPPCPSPRRPSQVVHESAPVATPTGQHVVVTLERTSTGGTRREAKFTRTATGSMSDAERAQKKRLRKSLFPTEQATQKRKHAERMKTSRTAKKAARDYDQYDRQEDRDIVANGGYKQGDWFHKVDDALVDRAKLRLGLPSECKTIEEIDRWRDDMAAARSVGKHVDDHWRPPWLLARNTGTVRGRVFLGGLVDESPMETLTDAQTERMRQDVSAMKAWLSGGQA
jgi:hypothetical protein